MSEGARERDNERVRIKIGKRKMDGIECVCVFACASVRACVCSYVHGWVCISSESGIYERIRSLN